MKKPREVFINRFYLFFKPGLFPFSICFFLGLYVFTYHLFNFPSPQNFTILVLKWFNQYGFWFLFFAAFLEGIFVVGMYFPGSMAIALAIFTLGKTPIDLFYIGSVSFISFLLANIVNYLLGKFGYHRLLLLMGNKEAVDKVQISMKKYGRKIFFITGFFPNFIAITSVCAGISKINIIKTVYLLCFSLLFWVTIWTIIGSIVINKINLQDGNQSAYLIGIIFLWGIFLVLRRYYLNHKNVKSAKKS